MCLFPNSLHTEQFLQKVEDSFVFYKKLLVKKNKLVGPVYHQKYKPGWNRAKIDFVLVYIPWFLPTPNWREQEQRYTPINRAIYGYTKPRRCVPKNTPGFVFVEMTAKKEDVLGIQDGDIAVAKAFLSPHEYQRAMEEKL